MSKSSYIILAIIAIFVGTWINYSMVGSDSNGSGSRGYGGGWGGYSGSSGGHK